MTRNEAVDYLQQLSVVLDSGKFTDAVDTLTDSGKAEGRAKAHWNKSKDLNGNYIFICSGCGAVGDYDNYCRCCGADMNGDDE